MYITLQKCRRLANIGVRYAPIMDRQVPYIEQLIHYGELLDQYREAQWPPLLTWINLNTSMDK